MGFCHTISDNSKWVLSMNKQIHIFAGHFGSGKTEVALNFARKQRELGKNVVIIDIDIVNPYFRTNDAAQFLEKLGIRLISNKFASTNLDMPIVPPEVLGVFDSDDEVVIFDVGGDCDGAYALGQYFDLFSGYGYEMHYIVNTKRPLTSSCDELLEMAREIENASRLKFTDIYNNTNLAAQTTTSVLLSGEDILKELGDKMKIPVSYRCATHNVAEKLPRGMNAFEMEITIKMPF